MPTLSPQKSKQNKQECFLSSESRVSYLLRGRSAQDSSIVIQIVTRRFLRETNSSFERVERRGNWPQMEKSQCVVACDDCDFARALSA